MDTSKLKKPAPTRSVGPLLLGVLVLALLVAIAIPIYFAGNIMNMSGSAPENATQLKSASQGSQATIALEVTSVNANNTLLAGNLLQKNSDGSYTKTQQTDQVQVQNTTSFTMGSSTDMKAGAVLQISGRTGQNNIVNADQIVVLTNVVHVK